MRLKRRKKIQSVKNSTVHLFKSSSRIRTFMRVCVGSSSTSCTVYTRLLRPSQGCRRVVVLRSSNLTKSIKKNSVTETDKQDRQVYSCAYFFFLDQGHVCLHKKSLFKRFIKLCDKRTFIETD